MNALIRPGIGRAVSALCLVTFLSAAAAARDPNWYGDVQYLTWDVRADEAEAARAAGSDGQVYLRSPNDDRNCTWYESSGSDVRPTGLVSVCQGQLMCLGQRLEEQAKSWYSACAGRLRGGAACQLPTPQAAVGHDRLDQAARANRFTR